MYLLGLGLIFLAMKVSGLGPGASWAWWVVLLPFVLAAVWWAWADWSGFTKRKAMDKEDLRRQQRIQRSHEALGTPLKKRKR